MLLRNMTSFLLPYPHTLSEGTLAGHSFPWQGQNGVLGFFESLPPVMQVIQGHYTLGGIDTDTWGFAPQDCSLSPSGVKMLSGVRSFVIFLSDHCYKIKRSDTLREVWKTREPQSLQVALCFWSCKGRNQGWRLNQTQSLGRHWDLVFLVEL
jgi:hypothetical protein